MFSICISGLGRLSPALVRLIANLCQTQQGLSDTLVNGYLSATLAKVDILYPIIARVLLPGFETDPFEPITRDVNSGGLPQFPPVLAEQTEQIRYITAEVASCILLFARCANFASQVCTACYLFLAIYIYVRYMLRYLLCCLNSGFI